MAYPSSQNAGAEKRPLVPRIDPKKRVFFLVGTDATKLADARRELLGKLMTPEERDQNFTEIAPSSAQLLSLDRVAGRIIDELGTPSFFPDQRRVIYVEGVQEFFSKRKRPAKKKPTKKAAARKAAAKPKVSGLDRLVGYLTGDFSTSDNILIVEARENEDKRRKVDDKNPLIQFLMRQGMVLRFYEPVLRWEFEDALLERDSARAIALYREWIGPDTRFAVLGVITDMVRCTLQASLGDYLNGPAGARLQGRTVSDLMPGGWKNLAGKQPRQRGKYQNATRYYKLPELIDALERLPELNEAFFPTQGAPFVRDLSTAVESYILRLCAR